MWATTRWDCPGAAGGGAGDHLGPCCGEQLGWEPAGSTSSVVVSALSEADDDEGVRALKVSAVDPPLPHGPPQVGMYRRGGAREQSSAHGEQPLKRLSLIGRTAPGALALSVGSLRAMKGPESDPPLPQRLLPHDPPRVRSLRRG